MKSARQNSAARAKEEEKTRIGASPKPHSQRPTTASRKPQAPKAKKPEKRPEWNSEVYDPMKDKYKVPEVNQDDSDMFDLDHGSYEQYNEKEEEENQKVYDMYEEMLALVQ